MYIVKNVYSDNTADILDIVTLQQQFMTEKELIGFGFHNKVLGLSTNGHKLGGLIGYDCITFPTEAEAYEYADETGISRNQIINMNDYYYILYKNNRVINVGYYVLHWTEYEQSYVSKKGYTPYVAQAKLFSKEDAQKKAAMMNRKRGWEYWITQRVVL